MRQFVHAMMFLLAMAACSDAALNRPLWATCTFGTPRKEEGLTLVSTTNVVSSNGKQYLQQNPAEQGVLSFSVAPSILRGGAHGVFFIVDADSASAGAVSTRFRPHPDSSFADAPAVQTRTSGSVTRRVFFLETADVAGGISVAFAGFGPKGLTLRTVRVWGAPGPYVTPARQSFTGPSFLSRQPLVSTYYFYWYDVYTGLHMRNPDGSDALQDHPDTLDDFSFTSVEWHTAQMGDMIEAGIDIVLPVYWGGSVEMNRWAVEGIEKLVLAQQQMRARGENPPKIGMFFDTSTLEHSETILKFGTEKSDLTTLFGQAFFFKQIRDFYSLVPPELWARLNDQPIVVLYGASFASKHDQNTLTSMYERFASSFGGLRPFVIKEVSWQVHAPFEYAWGAALNGPQGYTGTAAVGPGYNDSAVPGRSTPVRERDNGDFYRQSWRQALSWTWGNRFFLVETWNEFHEGTGIARSREYGDQYIRLTRQFADMHKGPVRFSDPQPKGWVRSLSATVSVRVEVDNVSRLNPLSARCKYSSDSGETWSEVSASAAVSGDTVLVLVAADVPFGAGSTALATPNRFVFTISNASGDSVFQSLSQPVWLGYPPAAEGRVGLGSQNNEQGVRHVLSNSGDGWTAAGTKGDRQARYNIPQPGQGSYFYFQVDDSLISHGSHPEVRVEITYWDGEGTSFDLQYDSQGPAFLDAYKNAGRRNVSGVPEWRTTTFTLNDARFGNRQNGGSDFRVDATGVVWLESVRVYAQPRTVEVERGIAGERPTPWMGEPFPNPFNASVLLPLRLPGNEVGSVTLFNPSGQEIRSWVGLRGDQTLQWDGHDSSGRRAASGVYLFRLRYAGAEYVRKVVLTR